MVLVVKDIVVVFDREQGEAEELAKRGYRLHSFLKIRPTLKFYSEVGKITPAQLKQVLNYLDNPLG